MKKSLNQREKLFEHHGGGAKWLRDFILGGQDGLVNVLGIILGLAIGTGDVRVVIIGGLAAMFAESVSMGAVAYTSTKASVDYYHSQEARERYEMANIPQRERREVRDIYYARGFRGKLLKDVTEKICSDKNRWLDVMMAEELGLSKDFESPMKAAIIVFLAAMVGSFIPLFAFFLVPLYTATILSVIFSAIALFITGAVEAKLTVGNWIWKGIQLMVIGMVAAFVGFAVGKFTGYN